VSTIKKRRIEGVGSSQAGVSSTRQDERAEPEVADLLNSESEMGFFLRFVVIFLRREKKNEEIKR
jgi:hypothetical protein